MAQQMPHIVLVLHNIRSLHNVGSIFRTADAAAVEKIYLCGITPAPADRFGNVRPQLAKVSLGAEKTVGWDDSARLTTGASARSSLATLKLLEKLKKGGYKIFAVEQAKNSVPYYELRVMSHESMVAFVFGNEVKGLPLSILKRADKILEIPMRGAMVRQAHHPRRVGRGKESLNVAVAAGIVLFRMLYP